MRVKMIRKGRIAGYVKDGFPMKIDEVKNIFDDLGLKRCDYGNLRRNTRYSS